MKIFVMRHGTTVWNEKGITQGITNNRLSENGKKLVENTAQLLKNVKIDAIFVSPIMRTIQTANIVNAYHKVKVIKDPRLLEIDQGIFTGRLYKDLTEEDKYIKSLRLEENGMESYESVINKTKNFIQEMTTSKKYDCILVVTHNINAVFIESILNNEKLPENLTEKYFRREKYFNTAEVKEFNV